MWLKGWVQRYNAIWWQARPMVSFLLPQALGNRVASWRSGVDSDQLPPLRIFLRFSPAIFASEGIGDFAHPHLLESLEYLQASPLGQEEDCSGVLGSTFPLFVLCPPPPNTLAILIPNRPLVQKNAAWSEEYGRALEKTLGCDKAFGFQTGNVQSVHRALEGRTENEEEGGKESSELSESHKTFELLHWKLKLLYQNWWKCHVRLFSPVPYFQSLHFEMCLSVI